MPGSDLSKWEKSLVADQALGYYGIDRDWDNPENTLITLAPYCIAYRRNPIHIEGKWKRVVASNSYVGGGSFEKGLDLLFDLDADPGETTNVAGAHPRIVRKLDALLEQCRKDLGDSIAGVVGQGRRPIGWVPWPKPLTEFDANHPYYMAMYDLGDAG